MIYLRALGFWGLAVMLALVTGAVSTERALAQTVVNITVADLRDDTSGTSPKKAYEKVNEKIAAANVTGGTVVMFPPGTFDDVGEILIAGRKGTEATTSPAAPAKPITFRGDGTVFTGKVMINVQDSEYIVIEGFTFRDTDVPDRFTHIYTNTERPGRISNAPHELWEYEGTSVLWLNTAIEKPLSCPSDGPINNVTIRNNEFRNTHVHGINVLAGGSGDYVRCNNTSAMEISNNVFIGIGLGPNADYLDAAKSLPANRNWESAIQGRASYGWTVRGNYIGAERDGTPAAGTTWLGIKVDNAFGKTLVENNVVNGTASSGIVVGGDGTAPAAEAEITIRNNRVTNSRNDAWFAQLWADGFFGSPPAPTNGYIGPWTPGAGMLVASYSNTGMTDEQADELLMAEIHALPSGFSEPYLGGGPRAVSDIVTYDNAGDRQNTGDTSPGVSPGTYDNIPAGATVRNLKPGIEAGIELNRLTAKTILVENNVLTNNVVGLSVCPSWYCFADHAFQSIIRLDQTPSAGSLKVPEVRNNRIYDNQKATDMPSRFVRADVVNALTTTNVGTGNSNVLVLKGNYLGDSPEVEGAVNTDGLASGDDLSDVGPKETIPPALDADASGGGASLGGTAITLTYDENLDSMSVPAAAAFTVTQTDGDGLSAPIRVTGVAVSGMSVTLTLASAPVSGAGVTVSYDPADAGSGTGVGPIRDVEGNAAPALTSRAVTVSIPPVDPDPNPMGPGDPQPVAGGGDGGCALASGGSGTELGALLPLMLAMLVFGLERDARKKS